MSAALMNAAARREAVVLLSGGIDSAACLHFISARLPATPLFVDYGQKAANVEERHARIIATRSGLGLRTIRVQASSEHLTSGELIGRNSLLVLAALFYHPNAVAIATGIHAGTNYYDCSSRFIQLLSTMVSEMTNGATAIMAPFQDLTKAQVFDYAYANGVHISDTYSCENGLEPPCQECASCKDRAALLC